MSHSLNHLRHLYQKHWFKFSQNSGSPTNYFKFRTFDINFYKITRANKILLNNLIQWTNFYSFRNFLCFFFSRKMRQTDFYFSVNFRHVNFFRLVFFT